MVGWGGPVINFELCPRAFKTLLHQLMIRHVQMFVCPILGPCGYADEQARLMDLYASYLLIASPSLCVNRGNMLLTNAICMRANIYSNHRMVELEGTSRVIRSNWQLQGHRVQSPTCVKPFKGSLRDF
ncbi:hypothetical protein GDO78_004167 [Eleutherodactylus coqui]|uniref:Uncharacterized protein n=1 Tax=Eleutherodactylus coqui TaxID=57060 RepID=A0A8J6ERJ1_ELECQ|nr:hypothetical protein GDO78_004167 [Eleutherodactylus coqui]